MDRLGFIHEELDIKILILFILSRLSAPVEPETLLELCQCDGGIGYFDYTECLNDLVENGHICRTEEGYAVTAKGRRNAEAVESSLPFSVRAKALKLLEPVEERMRREALLTARHETGPEGCLVELAMGDGQGELFHLRLLCAGEEQARQMEKNFRRNAERLYQQIAALLAEGKI